MAISAGKLFTELLTLAGYDLTDEALQAVLTLEAEVPEEAAKSLKTNLLTVESAKNDPTLKAHFTAYALNQVDREIEEEVAAGTFSDEQKAALKAETSSYKRLRLLNKSIREIEAAKATGDPADKDKLKSLRDEVQGLNAKILESTSTHEAAITAAGAGAEASILEYAMSAELGSKTYANDTLDKSVNLMVAKEIVSKKLTALGASLKRAEDGSLTMVRTDDPEMAFMVENKNVEFGSFVDGVLSESKMIKVSDPAGADLVIPKTIPQTIPIGGGTGDNIPAEAANSMAEQIAAFD